MVLVLLSGGAILRFQLEAEIFHIFCDAIFVKVAQRALFVELPKPVLKVLFALAVSSVQLNSHGRAILYSST